MGSADATTPKLDRAPCPLSSRRRYTRVMADDPNLSGERARNLWASFERKFPNVSKATTMVGHPSIGVDDIGGLHPAKEEVLTYACAATDREVYERWGTFPPSALLLIGPSGSGKTLLAQALATRTETPFLGVHVPGLVMEVIHRGGQIGELLSAWGQALSELPMVTVFFEELEFLQAQEIGVRRPDLPEGPIMDFLLEILDRTIEVESTLVVGSTSHPDSMRPALLTPRRFERVVEVNPIFPADVVEALQIHVRAAEARAGKTLFGEVDWEAVVRHYQGPSTGEWIRLMHAVLRRKARCEAAGEPEGAVSTPDLLAEVDRFRRARGQLPHSRSGIYL